jgi:2-haloacid dehalogenase
MLDFSRFAILTFDCYGTLINWEDSILRCLNRILAAHSKDTDDATLLQLYGDFEASAEQGECRCYRDVLHSVVDQFGERFGFAPGDQEAGSLAESLKKWKPWPDTIAALRVLETHFQLAIISNVDDDLFAATRPQLEVDFAQIITAQQARAYKPSLKIFELALSRIVFCTWAKVSTMT